MQHSGGFKRSKQTLLFADADTIISVHGVMCDIYQSRLEDVQRSRKLATYERPDLPTRQWHRCSSMQKRVGTAAS